MFIGAKSGNEFLAAEYGTQRRMRDALAQIGITAATILYLVALVVVAVLVLGLLNVWIFHVSLSSR